MNQLNDKIPFTNKKITQNIDYTLNTWEKIKLITIHPTEFFDMMRYELDIKKPIMFFLIIQLIMLPINILMFQVTEISRIFSYLGGLLITIPSFLLALWLIHFIVIWLGGQEARIRTFQAYLYSTTPAILLSWVPIINIIASFYSMGLTIKGLISLQKMTLTKAIIVYCIPLVILILFSLIPLLIL